jgi:hypothetical protein
MPHFSLRNAIEKMARIIIKMSLIFFHVPTSPPTDYHGKNTNTIIFKQISKIQNDSKDHATSIV